LKIRWEIVMRASFKTSVAASLAAVTLLASVVAADANPWRRGYGHHGFGWGPGFVLSVLGAGLFANSCLRYAPIYDAWGNYVGRRVINVCY
jgi:hypothetical protein